MAHTKLITASLALLFALLSPVGLGMPSPNNRGSHPGPRFGRRNEPIERQSALEREDPPVASTVTSWSQPDPRRAYSLELDSRHLGPSSMRNSLIRAKIVPSVVTASSRRVEDTTTSSHFPNFSFPVSTSTVAPIATVVPPDTSSSVIVHYVPMVIKKPLSSAQPPSAKSEVAAKDTLTPTASMPIFGLYKSGTVEPLNLIPYVAVAPNKVILDEAATISVPPASNSGYANKIMSILRSPSSLFSSQSSALTSGTASMPNSAFPVYWLPLSNNAAADTAGRAAPAMSQSASALSPLSSHTSSGHSYGALPSRSDVQPVRILIGPPMNTMTASASSASQRDLLCFNSRLSGPNYPMADSDLSRDSRRNNAVASMYGRRPASESDQEFDSSYETSRDSPKKSTSTMPDSYYTSLSAVSESPAGVAHSVDSKLVYSSNNNNHYAGSQLPDTEIADQEHNNEEGSYLNAPSSYTDNPVEEYHWAATKTNGLAQPPSKLASSRGAKGSAAAAIKGSSRMRMKSPDTKAKLMVGSLQAATKGAEKGGKTSARKSGQKLFEIPSAPKVVPFTITDKMEDAGRPRAPLSSVYFDEPVDSDGGGPGSEVSAAAASRAQHPLKVPLALKLERGSPTSFVSASSRASFGSKQIASDSAQTAKRPELIDYRKEAASREAEYTMPLLLASSGRRRPASAGSPTTSTSVAYAAAASSKRGPEQLDKQSTGMQNELGKAAARSHQLSEESRMVEAKVQTPDIGLSNMTELVVNSTADQMTTTPPPPTRDSRKVAIQSTTSPEFPPTTAATMTTPASYPRQSASTPSPLDSGRSAAPVHARRANHTHTNHRTPDEAAPSSALPPSKNNVFHDHQLVSDDQTMEEFGRISESLQPNPLDLMDLQNSRSRFSLPAQLESLSMLLSAASSRARRTLRTPTSAPS